LNPRDEIKAATPIIKFNKNIFKVSIIYAKVVEKVKNAADMFDGVKWKRFIHSPHIYGIYKYFQF